ncbi:MAG TPA: TA system VapC family ribonuclease toxin [Nitriliruptorales bacterium]
MIAFDTNILLYAHREEFEQHTLALQRLRAAVEGDVPFAVPVFVLGEFLRVATHPRVLTPPSDLPTAIAALDAVVASPMARVLHTVPAYWSLLGELVVDARARGNAVFDAQIAALCRAHGVDRILTEDRDFRRFPGLERVSLAG